MTVTMCNTFQHKLIQTLFVKRTEIPTKWFSPTFKWTHPEPLTHVKC